MMHMNPDQIEAHRQAMNAPVPGYGSYRQQITMWIRFRVGAKVRWCPDPQAARLLHGISQGESVTRPGWYFIRDEEGRLHLVNWAILQEA